MNQLERQLLQLLYDLYKRDISDTLATGVAQDDYIIFLEVSDAPENLPFGAARSLANSEYIYMRQTARDSYRLGITPKGRQIVENNFQEVLGGTSGSQTIQFFNSTVGNAAFSQSGQASIGDSPVDQRSIEVVDQLLAQLMDAIRTSELPDETKQEAMAESQQLAIEVRRPHPMRARLRASVDRLLELAAPATAVLELANAICELQRTMA